MTISRAHGQLVALVQITTNRPQILDMEAADVITCTLDAEKPVTEAVRNQVALGACCAGDGCLKCDRHV